MVASGADGSHTDFSSSTVARSPSFAPSDPTPDIHKMPFVAALQPLLAAAGRAVATQGVKGALKTGAKKIGEKATKEGLKDMATQGAKQLGEKVASKEGMEQTPSESHQTATFTLFTSITIHANPSMQCTMVNH